MKKEYYYRTSAVHRLILIRHTADKESSSRLLFSLFFPRNFAQNIFLQLFFFWNQSYRRNVSLKRLNSVWIEMRAFSYCLNVRTGPGKKLGLILSFQDKRIFYRIVSWPWFYSSTTAAIDLPSCANPKLSDPFFSWQKNKKEKVPERKKRKSLAWLNVEGQE